MSSSVHVQIAAGTSFAHTSLRSVPHILFVLDERRIFNIMIIIIMFLLQLYSSFSVNIRRETHTILTGSNFSIFYFYSVTLPINSNKYRLN